MIIIFKLNIQGFGYNSTIEVVCSIETFCDLLYVKKIIINNNNNKK